MPGNPMVIGPFIRGLNNVSTAGESEDTEVVELINMEVSLDKSLESRPPFIIVPGSLTSRTETHRHKVYGTYFISETEWYLIVLWPTAGHARLRAHLRGDMSDFVDIKTFSSILTTDVPSDMVQFKDSLFFSMPTGSTSDGFSWNKIDGVKTLSAMPKCNVLISWKNRLWAAGSPGSASEGDRVWFSSVDKDGLHPDKWEAVNFFDTAPGEGGFITAMLPHFNNLIIFKNDGTWRFSYSVQPAQGLVEKISGSVGTASKDSVVEFENMIFCYDQGTIYELVNSTFNPINIKLKFKSDASSNFIETRDVTLSTLNRRLVVRYRNAIYVYSAETRTWCQWRSSRGLPYKFYELPGDSSSSDSSTYIAAQNSPAYRSDVISQEFTPLKANPGNSGSITYDKGNLHLGGFTEDSTIVLNGPTSISCSPAQQIAMDLNIEDNTFTKTVVQLRLFDIYGTPSFTAEQPLTAGANRVSLPTSNNTVLFDVLLKVTPADLESTLTGTGMTFTKEAGNTPSYLFTFKHKYEETSVPQENIECSVTTKVYDFGIPSVFKRLFLWGIDIRTVASVAATALQTRKNKPLTFGEIDGVDNSILATGTWGSPLLYDREDSRVIDITDPIVEQTDNNRFFIKLHKGLRFRQIAFNIKTVTDGTTNTGPVKMYTVTAYVSPKQMVVDKIS